MNPRSSIYYWKCDRPAAFHGTDGSARHAAYAERLATVLQARFPGQPLALRPAASQGNHITWRAKVAGMEAFVRVEDGPEHDDYIEVESRVLADVRALGVPAPRVLGVDASRRHVPFAWQVLEHIACPDLNQLYKAGRLALAQMAHPIGAAVARWQSLQPRGFGPFTSDVLRRQNRLEGFHPRYAAYFFLHLDRHLHFLVEHAFLAAPDAAEIKAAILQHQQLLALDQGCLVHKDLALWNILGTETELAAFIDWDDAIAGDPMDDLALLGCFYDGAILARALAGYTTVRALPEEHRRRFWLHLLRNMLVKAVIRVGAGYFDRTDQFFLIGAGGTGTDLKTFTRQRLTTALNGLRDDRELATL
jgi:aminoglycoside phosphotransferase (APT) family kinase protein